MRPRILGLALLFVPSILSAQAPQLNYDWDKLRDEAAGLLSSYIAVNTSSPPGNELATARWLQAIMTKEGIESQVLDTTEIGPGRANFYARLKGDGSKRAIALVHHMDVVPVTRENWKEDPFAGVIKDGVVWGRGALDMKGHGIIQLMAFIAIKRAGIKLHRDLVYIGNADEETDGAGAIVFTQRHADLIKDVEYLLTEGSDTRVENGKVRWFGINVGEKRPLWTRMVAEGVTSHGSVPVGDLNPVPRIARAITRVAAWQTPVRLTPAVERFFKAQGATETGEAKRWLSDPRAALANPVGRKWLLREPERNALLRNTISPTVITGSNKTNTIPQFASAELDIRILPDQDPDVFLKELVRVIGDSTIRLQEISPLPPRFDAPLDTDLFHAIERVAGVMLPGVPVATDIGAGATDRPTYAKAGITAYGLDPYLIPIEENRTGVHGNDERLSVQNIGWGVQFYLRLLHEVQ